jgi:hypothetical protein
MFVASLLTQNQKFQDTLTRYEYIFNPSDNSTCPVPARFWEFAPFYTMNANNATEWNQQQINDFMLTLAADTAQKVSNDFTNSATNAIIAWMNDPYDPHMVASTRISAYAKATVMKFLDNLIAWGDALYAQYTSETVSQAEQLYVFADLILGPQPDQLRMPTAQPAAAPSYASLQNIDPFSNVLVNVENGRRAGAAAVPRPGHRERGFAAANIRRWQYSALLHPAQPPVARLLGNGRAASLQHSPLL